MKKPRLLLTNVLIFTITGLIAAVLVPFEALTNGFDALEITACIVLITFQACRLLPVTIAYGHTKHIKPTHL